MTFEDVMVLTRTVSSATAFEDEECRALYDRCMAVPRSGLVVEIGCQLGRTSSIIAQVAKERDYNHIHIDPYTEQPEYLVGWIRMMHGIGNPFTFLCMRTDQAMAILEDLSGYNFDLVLIDGDHTEHGVRTDCEILGPMVKSGGYLLAHDFGRDSLPDVYNVLSEYAVEPNWEPIGIYGTLGVWRRR